MPIINDISQLQNLLEQRFRQPGESDEQWRERMNHDPGLTISINLFDLPELIGIHQDNLRREAARPAVLNEPFDPPMGSLTVGQRADQLGPLPYETSVDGPWCIKCQNEFLRRNEFIQHVYSSQPCHNQFLQDLFAARQLYWPAFAQNPAKA